MAGPNFRWLVNFGLLILPIAVTLGVLIGLQKQRDATGGAPLFNPPSQPGLPPTAPINNSLSTHEYCQKSFGITPNTKGQEFTLNPNQWGWTQGTPGNLCMNVTTYNNNTYPTKFTAPEWSVTWQYPQGPEDQPVHAFPNVMLDGGALPVTLSTISSLKVDLEWTYGTGDDAAASTSTDDLATATTNANVCIDMFLDSDKSVAQDSAKADFEVMIWFMAVGSSTDPVGTATSTVKTVSGTEFTLWAGKNGQGQTVLTWKAGAPAETFNADINTFLDGLDTIDPSYPSTSDYLGYMAMGTETYYATSNVTFHASTYTVDIETTT